MYYVLSLKVRSLKHISVEYSPELHFFSGSSRRKCALSLPFLAFRNYLHPLVHGSVFCLRCQQLSIPKFL